MSTFNFRRNTIEMAIFSKTKKTGTVELSVKVKYM